jgi:3-oxoadipate enol-lactonase
VKGNLRYAIEGRDDLPLLVLANPLGTTMKVWQPLVPALAAQFQLLRFDHRGHGGSWCPPQPWSIADIASDVASLLDDLSVSHVRFAGLSLGGMVGIWLAAHRPDLVERLIVACSSAHLDAAGSWRARAAIVRASGMAPIVDPVVDRWFTPGYASEHPAVADGFKEMLASMPPAGYAACCDALASLDLRADLVSVKATTTVVSGSDDLAIPPSHGKAISDAIPGASFVVVRDSAHLAVVEQPGQLAQILIDYLGTEA